MFALPVNFIKRLPVESAGTGGLVKLLSQGESEPGRPGCALCLAKPHTMRSRGFMRVRSSRLGTLRLFNPRKRRVVIQLSKYGSAVYLLHPSGARGTGRRSCFAGKPVNLKFNTASGILAAVRLNQLSDHRRRGQPYLGGGQRHIETRMWLESLPRPARCPEPLDRYQRQALLMWLSRGKGSARHPCGTAPDEYAL